jgi:hypothetical protein
MPLTCSKAFTIKVKNSCVLLPTFNTLIPSAILFNGLAFAYKGGTTLIASGVLSPGDLIIYDASSGYGVVNASTIGPGFSCLRAGYSLLADQFVVEVQDNGSSLAYAVLVNPLDATFLSGISLDNLVNGMGVNVGGSIFCADANGLAYISSTVKVIAVDCVNQVLGGLSAAVAGGFKYSGQIAYDPVTNRVFTARTRNVAGTGTSFVDILHGTTLALLGNFSPPGAITDVYSVVYCPDNNFIYVAGNDNGADGGFVVWVINSANNGLVATLRYPTVVFLWTKSGFYNSFNHQVIFSYVDNAGTSRSAVVICADTNTAVGLLNQGTLTPFQAAFDDVNDRLLFASSFPPATGRINIYDS